MLNSFATRWHTSLSQFKPYCASQYFGYSWKIEKFFTVITEILWLDHGSSLVSIFRCAFRYFFRFSLTFLYFGDEHDQHVYYKWHAFVILYFMSSSEAPLCISSVHSFPLLSAAFLIMFSVVLHVGTYICMSSGTINHLSEFPYICNILLFINECTICYLMTAVKQSWVWVGLGWVPGNTGWTFSHQNYVQTFLMTHIVMLTSEVASLAGGVIC